MLYPIYFIEHGVIIGWKEKEEQSHSVNCIEGRGNEITIPYCLKP
jgi:hypothetical protein